MFRFTLKDLVSSAVTGFTTGFIGWKILEYLDVPPFLGWDWSVLVFATPVLWFLGVNLGYFLGRWIPFFDQFGKFAAVGFANAAVDFGVLNLLMSSTGIVGGWMYSVFKAVSFICAMFHSYFWNRTWVFEGAYHERGEFLKFASVTIASLIINVLTASAVVHFSNGAFGIDEKIWANIGAVAGSAFGLISNFLGLKFAVFKR